MEQYEEFSFKEHLNVLRKYWRLIVFVFILGVVSTAILSYFIIKPEYKVTTILFVGRMAQTKDPSLDYNQMIMDQQLIKDYEILIKSRSVIQDVIQKLNLKMSPEQFEKRITINVKEDTRFIKIEAYDENPELAKNIANMIARVFIDKVYQFMKMQNVQIVDAAQIPTVPFNLRPMFNMAVAGLVSLVISIFIVFLLESLNDTLKTAEEIERYLGLPVLGVIPSLDLEYKKE